MDNPSSHPDASSASLRAALDNERTNADHLRVTLRQQKALLRRPIVRVALQVDRRTAAVVRLVERRRERLRRRSARAALVTASLASRRQLDDRRRDLARRVDHAEGAPRTRSVSLIVTGADPGRASAIVEVLAGSRTPDDAPLEVILAEPDAPSPTAAAAAAAATATGRVIGFLAATSVPDAPSWLGHLVAAIGDDVAAATPLLVHPERPLREATPHDLLVRELGLDIVVTDASVPVVSARDAGDSPGTTRQPVDVDAASSACLLVEREAFIDAGGLGPLPDLDAAVIDLCTRLRAAGRRILAVPAAVVVDGRPVASLAALRTPIPPASPAWTSVVDRQGPTLVQLARGDTVTDHLRLAVTVAAPSLRAAPQWGDWHLAQALARSLRRRGHSVHLQTLDQADHPTGRSCDVHLVLRGLSPVRRTSGQRHVLWIISHPESVDLDECDEADLVLVASEHFASTLRERTTTPVEVMLQATDPRRFAPREPDPRHSHAIAAVATTRHVFRPAVRLAIEAGLHPAIYGTGWEEFVDPGLVVAEFVPNEQVASVYSSVGVLLNDHWDTMRVWGFVSNRIFDALACGTPIVSDHLPEIEELFGGAVATFRSADDLATAVGEALDDPIAARRRAADGRRIVMAAHTFDQRADELVALLARHGLGRTAR